MDAYHLYVPFYAYTSANLSSLHIPLWNPYQMCGVPYLGVLQGAVFYPPVLLFAILPPAKAYSVYWMMHAVLGGFFLMLFSRHLKLSWLASLAGAITFMFCSNTATKFFGPAFLANSIYLPLMFMFTLKIFETGRFKWAVALTVVVALPLFAGWIQALVYCLYALGVFVVAIVIRALATKSDDTVFIRRGLALLAFSGALFFLLSAVQTLPALEMSMMATRSLEGLSEEMVTINNTAMYSADRLLFDSVNSKGGLLPFYSYMGALPFLLSIVALWHKRLRFIALFLCGLAVCALILSMGPQTPLYSAWLHLPMSGMFRAPFRFLFLYAFSVSILCAIGIDYSMQRLESWRGGAKGPVMFGLLAMAAASCLLVLPWLDSVSDPSWLVKTMSAASQWPLYLLAFALLLLILTTFKLGRATKYLLGVGCIALILVDLFRVNHNLFYLPEKNPEIYEKHASVVEELKARTARDHARVFVAADMLDFSYCIKLGQLTGISLVNDYENMNTSRYNRYCTFMLGKNDRRSREFFWGWFNLDEPLVHPKLLNYMSAKYLWVSKRYLAQNKETISENFSEITRSSSLIYADDLNMLFLNPKALPRVYVVGRSLVVEEEEEVLKLLASDAFSPTMEVILSDGPQRGNADSILAASRSTAVINSVEPEMITITAEMEDDGFLVLTDQDYPGWEASVDGVKVDIYRANYLFRCIALPAGRHEVVFRYRPMSFRLGAMLSLAGLLALVGGAGIPAIRKLRSKEG